MLDLADRPRGRLLRAAAGAGRGPERAGDDDLHRDAEHDDGDGAGDRGDPHEEDVRAGADVRGRVPSVRWDVRQAGDQCRDRVCPVGVRAAAELDVHDPHQFREPVDYVSWWMV